MSITEDLVRDVGVEFTDMWIVFGFLFGLQILSALWRLMKFFGRNCLRSCMQPPDRLYKMYAYQGKTTNGNTNATVATEKQFNSDSPEKDGSWAIVTGGSDGIGLAMCKILAKQGFNICIVSRTESKINAKLEEIHQECRKNDSSFKTRCVVADLSKLVTISEFRTTIGDKVKDIDVAILVCNAGYNFNGPVDMLTDNEYEGHFTMNILHVAYTFKAILPQMLERHEKLGVKSAFMVVSSIMNLAPTPGIISYSSSKMWASYFGSGIGPELTGIVDCIAYEPGGVATKMINAADRSDEDFVTVLPHTAAMGAFRDLGIEQLTQGIGRHEFLKWFLINFVPNKALQGMNAKMNRDYLVNKRAEDAKKKAEEDSKKNENA